MACCILLLRLLAPVASRLGVEGLSARAPRVPMVPMALLGLVELGAAVLILRGAEGGETAAAAGARAHHAHAMPMDAMSAGAVAGGSGIGVIAAIAAVATTGAIALASLRLARRAGDLVAAIGASAVTASAVLAVLEISGTSHAVMMVVIETALLIAPIMVVGPRVNRARADDLWVVVRGALAAGAAALAGFLLITLHLPATHHWYMGASGLRWWLTPLLFAAGVLFWSCVARFRLPHAWRSLALAAVLETGSVIGLVLLVAGDAVLPMMGTAGLGALADQRLAGAVMMLADLALLAWAIEPALASKPAPLRAAAAS